jgi:hypothetical protein
MFKTNLILQALIERKGKWEVVAPLVWSDEDGIIVVPTKFVTDLASIPMVARALIDVNGPHRRAATLHDYLFVTQELSLSEVDELFLRAMKADGVGWLVRNTMYSAVRLGSWMPWNKNKRKRKEDLEGFLREHGLSNVVGA